MNTILLWAMAVTAFIVTITGGVLLALLKIAQEPRKFREGTNGKEDS